MLEDKVLQAVLVHRTLREQLASVGFHVDFLRQYFLLLIVDYKGIGGGKTGLTLCQRVLSLGQSLVLDPVIGNKSLLILDFFVLFLSLSRAQNLFDAQPLKNSLSRGGQVIILLSFLILYMLCGVSIYKIISICSCVAYVFCVC